MPVPFILGGAALAASAFGVKKGYDGYKNQSEANKLNNDAKTICDYASEKLDNSRQKANNALEILGQAKIHIHENSFNEFIDIFTKIKNIECEDFSKDDLKFDIEEFITFTKESIISFKELVGGGIASLGAGALAGVGAYGSVGLLASASTGTAISTLSGAAATNATLAWLGGGSLAAGGFGMAGGMIILGSIVTAPVLAVGGAMFAKMSEKALDEARNNLEKAKIAEEQIFTAKIATDAISSIVEESLVVINKLDEKLVKELQTLKLLVIRENDYAKYSDGEKEYLRFVVNIVKTISGICKVNVLTVDGKVNREFRRAVENAQDLSDEIFKK